MKETWRDVVGYEGLYQVSNLGRIMSNYRWNGTNNRILKVTLDPDGYPSLTLFKKIKYSKKVHRIVAEAFIPNILNKPSINHKNGIKTDNRVENLEWVTNKENTNHGIKSGLIHIRGEQNGNRKLTLSQVLKIKKMKGKIKNVKIAKLFNISQSTISSIYHCRNWSYSKI